MQTDHALVHHNAIRVGNRTSEPYVMSATSQSAEKLRAGPTNAKAKFDKHAANHRPELAERVPKVESIARASMGEIIDRACVSRTMPNVPLGRWHHSDVIRKAVGQMVGCVGLTVDTARA